MICYSMFTFQKFWIVYHILLLHQDLYCLLFRANIFVNKDVSKFNWIKWRCDLKTFVIFHFNVDLVVLISGCTGKPLLNYHFFDKNMLFLEVGGLQSRCLSAHIWFGSQTYASSPLIIPLPLLTHEPPAPLLHRTPAAESPYVHRMHLDALWQWEKALSWKNGSSYPKICIQHPQN